MDCNNFAKSASANDGRSEMNLEDLETQLPFLCDLCGKRFEFSASLILHKSAHNSNLKSKRKRKSKKVKMENCGVGSESEENQTVPNSMVEFTDYSQSSNSPIYITAEEQKEYFQCCLCIVCDQPYLRKIISIDNREFHFGSADNRCPNCVNSQILIL